MHFDVRIQLAGQICWRCFERQVLWVCFLPLSYNMLVSGLRLETTWKNHHSVRQCGPHHIFSMIERYIYIYISIISKRYIYIYIYIYVYVCSKQIYIYMYIYIYIGISKYIYIYIYVWRGGGGGKTRVPGSLGRNAVTNLFSSFIYIYTFIQSRSFIYLLIQLHLDLSICKKIENI